MNTSTFDVASFANTEINDTNDDKFIPCPVGEYPATITKIEFKTTDKGRTIVDLTWKIQDLDGTIKAETGREEVTIRQGVFLDITAQGTLDVSKGKNINLGKVRTATGNNIQGKAFRFADLQGAQAKVQVSHRAAENSDDIYDQIKSVTAL